MSETKPYYFWIDNAKVVGIFLVIYGHGGLADYPIDEIIYTFHMPLFFFISGLLYHPMSPQQTLEKDWRTLLVPYLLLNLICLIPFMLSPLKGTFTFERLFQRLGAIAMGLGYEHDYWVPVSSPCWFLISLFLARIILSFAYKRLNAYTLSFVCLISILSTLYLHQLKFDLLVPLDSTFLAFPFICLGYALKPYWTTSSIHINRTKDFSLALVCLISLLLIQHFNGRVDTNLCIYGKSLLLYYAGGITGTFFILFISKCYRARIEVKQIASGTLLIIGLNLWMITFVKAIIQLFIDKMEFNSIWGLVTAIISFLCFIPLIRLTKKFCPILLGGRK